MLWSVALAVSAATVVLGQRPARIGPDGKPLLNRPVMEECQKSEWKYYEKKYFEVFVPDFTTSSTAKTYVCAVNFRVITIMEFQCEFTLKISLCIFFVCTEIQKNQNGFLEDIWGIFLTTLNQMTQFKFLFGNVVIEFTGQGPGTRKASKSKALAEDF